MSAPSLFARNAGEAPAPETALCDVALPVPLDVTFTYEIGNEMPVLGGRVLVPFREKKLSGIVTRMHNERPKGFTVKRVAQVLDSGPVLDDKMLELGRWIARYYLAPIGEVYRAMLPLQAELQRVVAYSITDLGTEALFADPGASRRNEEQQIAEMAVLDYLAEHEQVRGPTLCSATGASRALLRKLTTRKWIEREDLSAARDAARTVKIVALQQPADAGPAKLNARQKEIVELLAAAGGRIPLHTLRDRVSPASLLTLRKRGVLEIVREAVTSPPPAMKPRTTLDFDFMPEQTEALRRIRESVAGRNLSVQLLFGVTGSGKTAVYLAAMQEVLKSGRGALLLVPEIGLTPGMAADLYAVFGDAVAVLHSSLTDDERAEQWHRLRRGDARIAVGTRSAVFAPVHDLGLIIVDEEQDHSYKQEETPRYHARDVAIVRAQALGATVVLGSATPSLESWQNAQKGKFSLIELPDRVMARPLPEVELVDMRAEFQATGKESVLSRSLIEEVTRCLARGEQAMILLNRRGYSAFVMCRACGDTVQCRDCAVALTHHKREHRLICHYCGYQQPIPRRCPKCGSDYVQFLGTGSEKLEDLLHAAFPKARIARMDRDTVRGHAAFERLLAAFAAGEIDLLVGTQMIAKGHDVHGVTLVGVVGADTALSLPDFRAAERTFQLLTQVSGRSGRGAMPGKVVLQTYFPGHYAVKFASAHDFRGFAEKELRFRGWMHYPPFTALANVLVRSAKQEEAIRWSGILGRWFEHTRNEGVRVMGPAPAPIVRLKKDYRFHFVLKAASRERLNSVLRAMLAHALGHKMPRTAVIVDVDAYSLH